MAQISPSRRFRSSSAPIRPSPLSILSGPPSPALPLSPPGSGPARRRASLPSNSTSPLSPSLSASMKSSRSSPTPPPDNPLPWLWTCHLCDSTYSLGVTRKCLHDGHVFCSGTTRSKSTGQVKRHRSCASEFDYVGWSDWMHWRREAAPEPTVPKGQVKDCWSHCDYPSECRWGHNFGTTKMEEKKVEVEAAVEFRTDDEMEAELTDLNAVTTEIVVEQIVEAVKRTQKKNERKQSKSKFRGDNLLSPIREEFDENVASPTSPLRQHYSLPGMEDMVTYFTGSDELALSPSDLSTPGDEEDNDNDIILPDFSSAFSSSSSSSSDGEAEDDDDSPDTSCDEEDTPLDAGIAPTTPKKTVFSLPTIKCTSPSPSYCLSIADSPPVPGWTDSDSDTDSTNSDPSPELDLGIWDTRAGYFPSIQPLNTKNGSVGRRVFGVGKGMTALSKSPRVESIDEVDEKLLVEGMTD